MRVKFTWSEAAQQDFDILKLAIYVSTVLSYTNYNIPFELITEAFMAYGLCWVKMVIMTSNEQLSEVQKLHYLSAALINDARVLQTREDTFSSLFEALKDRYENERIIDEIQINSLLETNLHRLQQKICEI